MSPVETCDYCEAEITVECPRNECPECYRPGCLECRYRQKTESGDWHPDMNEQETSDFAEMLAAYGQARGGVPMISKPKARPVSTVTWDHLYKMAQKYVDDAELALSTGFEPVEYKPCSRAVDHIHEAVIEAVFGSEVWKYINQSPE